MCEPISIPNSADLAQHFPNRHDNCNQPRLNIINVCLFAALHTDTAASCPQEKKKNEVLLAGLSHRHVYVYCL